MTRPRIVCHMIGSIDGRLHPSRYTASADGTTKDWSAAYEAIHDRIGGDGWIVGRVTMAEMAKGTPHPPAAPGSPPRPVHVAQAKGPFAIALDRSARLHFAKPDIDGDPIVVLLGHDVPDAHLAELHADGISYIVAADADMALAPLLDTLGDSFGTRVLLLEGGGGVNGSFLAAGLVDELSIVLAPALDGGPTRGIVEAGEAGLKGKVRLSLIAADRLDHGALHLRYAVEPHTS